MSPGLHTLSAVASIARLYWSFLQQTLRMKGFSPLWCKWIVNIVSGGSVEVKVNEDIGHFFFQTKKGLGRAGSIFSEALRRTRDYGPFKLNTFHL